MLTIHYGDMENVIYNTSVYFDNVYSPQWFQDAFAQRIIKSIDKGSVVGPCAIDTKILGIIPPERLSGGTKTLLLSCTSCLRTYATPQTAATIVLTGF